MKDANQCKTHGMGRDKSLDIAKAICIILMVVVHGGCPTYIDTFAHMCCMPCFFFISGWLLGEKQITDIKTGLLRKTKSYYWPFVKWTLIFILFHNTFAWLHINPNIYSWRDFIERVARAFTMTGGESLLGGYWFLISLFWAAVFTILSLHLLLKKDKLTTLNISGGYC